MQENKIQESKDFINSLIRNRAQKRKKSLLYWNDNKDTLNEKRRAERNDKNSKIYKKDKEYKLNNKEYLSKKALEYEKKRKLIDPQYKMVKTLRSRLNSFLKNSKIIKNKKTLDYIGCTQQELKIYLENLFIEGMSWENHGEWHIDHKYPLSKFDLTKEDEIYKAMHYTNLQPLWASENIKKSNKINI